MGAPWLDWGFTKRISNKKYLIDSYSAFKGYCRLWKKCSKLWDWKYWESQEKRLPVIITILTKILKKSKTSYEVSLSFKENNPLIHDNFELRKNRSPNIYKQFKDNEEFLKQYDNEFKIMINQNQIFFEIWSFFFTKIQSFFFRRDFHRDFNQETFIAITPFKTSNSFFRCPVLFFWSLLIHLTSVNKTYFIQALL